MKSIKDTKLNFKGHTIYMGIDNHLKSNKVSYFVDDLFYKTITHPPGSGSIKSYLDTHFPGASYRSVYEAGFSGFGLHKDLIALGISNVVVHASDVPMGDKNREQKTDKRDSKQLARCLIGGLLTGIYVPSEKQIADRSLLRYRDKIVTDLGRIRNRIKLNLYYLGIEIPIEYQNGYWSQNFVNWLESWEFIEQSSRHKMDLMLSQFKYHRNLLLSVNRQLRELSRSDFYKLNYLLLISIPGIGPVGAMRILTEIGDMKRFKTEDDLCSYVGLIPNSRSSGEKQVKGRITYRAHKQLRTQLIESSWISIRNDPALALYYSKKMKRTNNKNRVIVSVARKLLCRIRAVLMKQEKYQINKS